MSGWNSVVSVAVAAALMACGSTSATNTGTPNNDAAAADAAGDSASVVDGGASVDAGPSSISGSADGTPFTNVASSYWIGAPDDPATTVVFVFSKPTACKDLSPPGWDKRITDGTQFLEMKMFGLTPATYNVTTSLTPAPGEASVNYTLSSQSSTPAESGSSAGTVTLSTVAATKNVTGSFALKFANNSLTGTYNAVFCPGGNEP
jgi:hypothetical protein